MILFYTLLNPSLDITHRAAHRKNFIVVAMGKTGKSTKKFQKKHLKHTIDHRKEVQKHKKLVGSRKLSKGSTSENIPNEKSKEVFEDMSVDDFFEGGFEVPKSKKGSKTVNESADDDLSSEEEDLDAMEQDMKTLKDKDPEFYKYLQDNDKGLLDFESSNPLDNIEDSDEDDSQHSVEEETNRMDKKASSQTFTKQDITLKLVQSWDSQLENPSPKIIQQICIAFKACININEGNDYKYVVTDPKAFSELMLLTLKKVPEAIQKLIKYKTSAKGVRSIPQKNQRVAKISLILKSHAASFITLLNDLNNVETATLVLFSLQELFPYYLSHRRLVKHLLSSVIDIWSSTTETDIQIATFAFLNNISKEFPSSILEVVLKTTYTLFLKNARKTNHFTMPLLNFSKNSASELYGIDETLSYQIGFEYVRQLAIHLRNSINATSNAKEGFKTVYNWQYCHSLDFWSRMISQHCIPEKELDHKNKESPLRQLIYPLVQVTLGTIRLIPTAQFFPLRFYLIRSLIRLSQSTGVFIPIFPLISEILTSTAFTKSPKKVNLSVFDFENNIKVNQQYLGTRVYQDGLAEQFIELTSEFFVLYCKNIAFPELVTPAVIALRRFVKSSKNVKFNKQLSQLIEKLNQNATYIISKRSNVEYGPSNKQEVESFLRDVKWEKTPLGQYVVVQRKVKEERLRLLNEAIMEEENSKKVDDNDEDIPVEDDDEDDDDE